MFTQFILFLWNLKIKKCISTAFLTFFSYFIFFFSLFFQDKKSDWRKKHNDFIEAIRQAKMVQQHLAKGGKVSDLPPPPPSDTSDYVPCPYCGRKFSPGVADRHIPKCKNILSNKKNPAAKKWIFRQSVLV